MDWMAILASILMAFALGMVIGRLLGLTKDQPCESCGRPKPLHVCDTCYRNWLKERDKLARLITQVVEDRDRVRASLAAALEASDMLVSADFAASPGKVQH